MRPISIRCSWDIHRYDEVDECNRVWCSRCGKREPKRFATIPDPALAGRELPRPKTKGQR